MTSNEGGQERPSRGIGLIWLLLASFALIALGLAIGAVRWLRDPLPPMTAADLEAAEARWQAHRPASYDLDLSLEGGTSGKVHVEVRDGRVVNAPTLNGRPIAARHTWDTWTIDGQFETIHRELELAENPEREMRAAADTRLILRAEFHPVYGYPLRYRRTVLGQGPEVYWETQRFQPVE